MFSPQELGGQLKSRWDGWLAIAGFIALGAWGPNYLDDHYVKVSEVQQMRQQMEGYQLENRQGFLQQAIYSITNKYKDLSRMSDGDRILLQNLKNQLDRTNKRLNDIDSSKSTTP